jgi:hypothetical protein
MDRLMGYGTAGPVLALIGWTFVMFVWLYATRIPAMRKARLNLQEMSRTGKKLDLPPQVSRVADNYNHLHEQPTLFYALALATEIVGAGDQTAIALAWMYVAVRVVHSLIQATGNIIIVRFWTFAIGTVVLFALFVHTALWVFA